MIVFYSGNLQDRKQICLDILGKENVLEVGDEQMEVSMEELLACRPGSLEHTHGTQDPFLYWGQEDPQKAIQLCQQLEEVGVDIELMAMATEHNKSWPLKKLYEEVQQEARWFAARNRLAQLIEQADRVRLQKEPQYRQAVYSCYALLQQEEVPLRLLEMGAEMLEKANLDI